MSAIPNVREDLYYNEKYLNPYDKTWLEGYDYVLDEVIESFFANLDVYDFEIEGEDIDIGRILTNHPEIEDKLKANLIDWLETTRNEIVTSMIDKMDDDEYDTIKTEVDKE